MTVCISGKVRYITASEARKALRRVRERRTTKRANELAVYPCEHCGGFHLHGGERRRKR